MNKRILKEKIRENRLSIKGLAEKMNMPASTLYTKTCGKYQFRVFEVQKLARILNLNIEDIKEIFFDEKVS